MASKIMQIGRLYFGAIDAKAELTSEPLGKRTYSRDSFFMPPGLSEIDLLSDRLFFIAGLKGIGKTALLRYMASEIQKRQALTEIFLFRDSMTSSAKYLADPDNTSLIDKNDDSEFVDFELPMLWFLHRQMKKDPHQYKHSSEFEEYETIIKLFLTDPSPKSGLSTLFPRLKDGNIEIAVNVLAQLKGSMRLNLEWLRDDSRQVPLEIVVELANERLAQLKTLPSAVRIFFDEIEVSLSSGKQFRRDAQIIRDFIVALAKINHVCMRNDVNLRLVAAIRTEVIRSAFATGKEIYKLIEDYGKKISWFERVTSENQPLLHVIESKIRASVKSIVFRYPKMFGTNILHLR